MSKAEVGFVYLNGRFVGELQKNSGEFFFEYDPQYISDISTISLSLSLPKATRKFHSLRLFPFFEGLLTEGWLKKIQEQNQRIDERDSFRRLLENGEELIGAVSILRVKK